MGKEPQYYDGSVSEGMSSLDRGRMERFNGAFFDALRVRPIGPPVRGYLLLSFRGYQRFYERLQLSHTCHPSPHYTQSLSFGGPPYRGCLGDPPYRGCLGEIMPVKRNGWSGFTGQCFVTTGSITMKHGRNGVGVSISWCRNFHKNTRNFK